MTWGEGGFSGPPKKGDVIYERPLMLYALGLGMGTGYILVFGVDP